MLLYNLFLFATTRDRVYAPYLLYLVSYICFQAAMNGYAKVWFFSESTSGLNTFLLVSNYLSGLGCFEFTNRFLRADMIGRFWSLSLSGWGAWLFLASRFVH